MIKPLFSLALVIGLGTSSGWAAQIDIPETCSPRLTIEKTHCAATTVFDCGDEIQQHTYQRGNLLGVHVFNRDWSLVRFEIADGRQNMEIEARSGEAITLDKLLTGAPISANPKASLTFGRLGARAYQMTVTGGLTDKQVEISGIAFRTGQMIRVMEPETGTNRIEFSFDIYASETRDLFFEGSHSRKTLGGEAEMIEQAPIALRYADEPGFLSDGSTADCDS